MVQISELQNGQSKAMKKEAFFELIKGLAGCGVNLGNPRVGDNLLCFSEEFAKQLLVKYVRKTFVEFDYESPEEIVEDFFEAYPKWAIFFASAVELSEDLEFDEGYLRMTSADWRVWVARLEISHAILTPMNPKFVGGKEDVEIEQDKNRLHHLTFTGGSEIGSVLVGLAIGVALTGAALPVIAEFAPGLVQPLDCRMPVERESRGE